MGMPPCHHETYAKPYLFFVSSSKFSMPTYSSIWSVTDLSLFIVRIRVERQVGRKCSHMWVKCVACVAMHLFFSFSFKNAFVFATCDNTEINQTLETQQIGVKSSQGWRAASKMRRQQNITCCTWISRLRKLWVRSGESIVFLASVLMKFTV